MGMLNEERGTVPQEDVKVALKPRYVGDSEGESGFRTRQGRTAGSGGLRPAARRRRGRRLRGRSVSEPIRQVPMGRADEPTRRAGNEMGRTTPRCPRAPGVGGGLIRLRLRQVRVGVVQIVRRRIQRLNGRAANGAQGHLVHAPARYDGSALGAAHSVPAGEKCAGWWSHMANDAERRGVFRIGALVRRQEVLEGFGGRRPTAALARGARRGAHESFEGGLDPLCTVALGCRVRER